MLYNTGRPACCMSCDNWSELEQGPCSNTEYRVHCTYVVILSVHEHTYDILTPHVCYTWKQLNWLLTIWALGFINEEQWKEKDRQMWDVETNEQKETNLCNFLSSCTSTLWSFLVYVRVVDAVEFHVKLLLSFAKIINLIQYRLGGNAFVIALPRGI